MPQHQGSTYDNPGKQDGGYANDRPKDGVVVSLIDCELRYLRQHVHCGDYHGNSTRLTQSSH